MPTPDTTIPEPRGLLRAAALAEQEAHRAALQAETAAQIDAAQERATKVQMLQAERTGLLVDYEKLRGQVEQVLKELLDNHEALARLNVPGARLSDQMLSINVPRIDDGSVPNGWSTAQRIVSERTASALRARRPS